jgi:hypothetical protein
MTNSTAKLFFIQLGKDIKQGFEECFAFCIPRDFHAQRISPRSVCDLENQVTNDLNNSRHTDIIVDEYGIPINIECDIDTSDIDTNEIEGDIDTNEIEGDIENQLAPTKKQIMPVDIDGNINNNGKNKNENSVNENADVKENDYIFI